VSRETKNKNKKQQSKPLSSVAPMVLPMAILRTPIHAVDEEAAFANNHREETDDEYEDTEEAGAEPTARRVRNEPSRCIFYYLYFGSRSLEADVVLMFVSFDQ